MDAGTEFGDAEEADTETALSSCEVVFPAHARCHRYRNCAVVVLPMHGGTRCVRADVDTAQGDVLKKLGEIEKILEDAVNDEVPLWCCGA